MHELEKRRRSELSLLMIVMRHILRVDVCYFISYTFTILNDTSVINLK